MGYSFGYETTRNMLTDMNGRESPVKIAHVLGDILADLQDEAARRGAAGALAEKLSGWYDFVVERDEDASAATA